MDTPRGMNEWLEKMSRVLELNPGTDSQSGASSDVLSAGADSAFPPSLKDIIEPKGDTTGCPPWPFPPKEKSAEEKIMDLLKKLQTQGDWYDDPLPDLDPVDILDDFDPWGEQPPFDPSTDICEPPVICGPPIMSETPQDWETPIATEPPTICGPPEWDPYQPPWCGEPPFDPATEMCEPPTGSGSILESPADPNVYTFLPQERPADEQEPLDPLSSPENLRKFREAFENPTPGEVPPEYYEDPIQYIAPGGAPTSETPPSHELPDRESKKPIDLSGIGGTSASGSAEVGSSKFGVDLAEIKLPDVELPDVELPSLDEVKDVGSEAWNIGSNAVSILGEAMGPVGTAVDVIGAGLGVYKIGKGMADGFDDDDIVDSEGNTTGEGFTGDDYLDIAEGNTDILASVGGIFGGPVGWAGSAGYAAGNLITSYAIDPYLNRRHTEDATDFGKSFDPESGKPYNPADDQVWWHEEVYEDAKEKLKEGYEFAEQNAGEAYDWGKEKLEEGEKALDDGYSWAKEKYNELDEKFDEYNEKFEEFDEYVDERLDEVDEYVDEKVEEAEEYVDEKLDEVDEYVDEKVEEAEEYVEEKVEDVKEAISDAGEAVGDAADSAKDYASDKASEAVDYFKDLF